mgnify:CR=1 FL=1
MTLSQKLRSMKVRQQHVANSIGVPLSTLNRWLTGARDLPAERVLDLEEATGITRYELRPDLYPPPGHARHTPAPVPVTPAAPQPEQAA